MNIIKIIDNITDFRYATQDKIKDTVQSIKTWKKEHVFQTNPYWSILPTVQVGKKEAFLYWLKWGVKF